PGRAVRFGFALLFGVGIGVVGFAGVGCRSRPRGRGLSLPPARSVVAPLLAGRLVGLAVGRVRRWLPLVPRGGGYPARLFLCPRACLTPRAHARGAASALHNNILREEVTKVPA